MEEKEKEELKLLGNKRKLEHENLDSKNDEEEGNNKINNIEIKDIINTTKEENKININLIDSSKNHNEINQDLAIKETLEDICQKCGIKNKLNSFKKGDDIYNYLLTNKKGNLEDIFILLESKYKNYVFKPEKKICDNCITDLIKDKINFAQFFSNEPENNPNINIIKDLEKNKNIDSNKKIENSIDNKKLLNLIEENMSQMPKNLNINNSNIIEQMQNKNNFNFPPSYINLFAQNNPNSNMQINPQILDILTQKANNIRNIQNMNQNVQNINNINSSKNTTSQIPYQFLLNNPISNQNQNIDNNNSNNNINDKIKQLIKNNALYGHAKIFPDNINNINNSNNINNINNQNYINQNINRNNLNNNANNNINTNVNVNTNANINPNLNTNNNNINNNFDKFENLFENQLKNLKDCINIQNVYFNQLLTLVMLFYDQVVKIKQLNDQNKMKNNIPYNLLNTLGNINPNNNININMNPSYLLQQQSFQNFFPNIMNNNLNPTQLNNLSNANINYNNNKNEKKDEDNINNLLKKDNSNINMNNINNEQENNSELNNDIKTNINEILHEENKQNKDITDKEIDTKKLNENTIEIVNKVENQSNGNININGNKNKSNNEQK